MVICSKYLKVIWNTLRVIPAIGVGEQIDSHPLLENPIEPCCTPYLDSMSLSGCVLGEYPRRHT